MPTADFIKDQIFHDKKSWKTFIVHISRYALRHPRRLAVVVFATLISSVADVFFPIILLKVIDNVLVPLAKHSNIAGGWLLYKPQLLQYGILFIALALVEVLSVGLFFYYTGKMKEQISLDLRNDLFKQFHRLSFSFYDKHPTGWLVTRITTDIDRISDFIAWGFTAVVKGSALMTLYFVFMFIYNIPLSLIVLIAVPILLFLSTYFRKQILKHSREARRINSEMMSYFIENINGIEINKSTVQEEQAGKRMEEYSSLLRRSSFSAANFNAFFGPSIIFFSSIVVAAVIVLGSYFNIVYQSISVGVLAAFFGYSRNLFLPVFDISRVTTMAQSSISAAERVFLLLDEQPAIVNKPEVNQAYELLNGDIEFRNVSFHYEPNTNILSHFNLKIPAGQSVALVGTTGCGKTTIANLTGRFYEPTSGEILLDEVNYQERTLKSLREQVGVVLQNPYIFTGSILENILYANRESTRNDAVEALKLIQAQGILNRLDEQTLEDGKNLSEGEKQIVAIARIIIKNPAIVIMDEATSALDLNTERFVQKGIEYLTTTRTSIIIAHRLSTIVKCDRILVIEQGQIIEDGNHAQLLKHKGTYKKLHDRQFSIYDTAGYGI